MPTSRGLLVALPDALILRVDSTYRVAISTPADGFQSWHWSTSVFD
jgi:hypothetical protein